MIHRIRSGTVIMPNWPGELVRKECGGDMASVKDLGIFDQKGLEEWESQTDAFLSLLPRRRHGGKITH